MTSTPSMQQLLEAGVHFGHQVRRGHPKMREYIYGAREGVHIINLEFSEKLLKEAADYAKRLGEEGKALLFIGTKKQAQQIVKEAAESAGAPYVTYRWLGGILTNLEEMRRNIKKLQDLKEKKAKGELGRYTKKEQLLLSRKIEKFDREFSGVINMVKLPDAVFIVDCVTEKIALAEAIRVDIPIIAITDSNANPLLVNYPIPGNDDATKSIKVMVDAIAESYKEGLEKFGKVRAAKEKQEQDDAAAADKLSESVSGDVEVAEEIVEKEAVKEAGRVS